MDDSRLRSLLLRFLEASDARAMEEFVASTRPRLLKAARRIGSPQDADDSVQAAYHALLQRGRESPPGPLFPWLLVATIRIAYRRKAMQQRARDLGNRLAVPASDRGHLESASRLEEARLVRDAITRLPSRYRDVVVLHYIEGLTAAEAARLLDISRSTVTTRLLRARRLLRSRLPQLTYALLLLPWFAADGWAAIAPAPAGAVMKGGGIALAWKAKSLVAVGLLAAGGAGMAIGHSSATTNTSPRRRRERPDTRVADLQQEIQELRQTNRSLQARLGEPPPRERPPEPATNKRAEAEQQAPPAIPDAIRNAGIRLGVSDEFVEAAWRALNAPNKDEKRAQIEFLKRGGKQGYLAYATLLYGGNSGPEMSDRLAELWSPQCAGAEEAIIEFIGLEKSYGYAKWSAYRSLGFADTPTSRDFLVRAAATEEQDGYYLSLARALGELKEPRAFDDLARRIAKKEWHRNVRGPIMHALIKIDPDRAKQVLIDHLRADDTDLLLRTLHYLGMIDSKACKSEARALLEGPRARNLDGETLRGIKRLVR